MLKFFRNILSAGTQESSKRFVVVECIIIFGLAHLVFLVLTILLFIKLLAVPPDTVRLFFSMYGELFKDLFYIVLFGIGAIVVSNVSEHVRTAVVEKANALASRAVEGGAQVEVQNAEQVNVGGEEKNK